MKVSELTRSAGYVRTTINLDEHQIKAAHKHNINVSMVCRLALGLAIKAAQTKQPQNLRMEP